MPGSKSNYLENKVLDGVLGGPALPLSATVYLALSTALYDEAATGSAMSEVAGGGYARVAATNDATSWPAAANSSKANGVGLTHPAATADWGTVVSFYIVDAASGGNVLYGGDLTTSRTIATGDTASFAAGAITVTED